MRLRTKNNAAVENRLMDTDELRAYTSLGRNSAIKVGNDARAKIKIGNRTLWDKQKIDQYFNALTGV